MLSIEKRRALVKQLLDNFVDRSERSWSEALALMSETELLRFEEIMIEAERMVSRKDSAVRLSSHRGGASRSSLQRPPASAGRVRRRYPTLDELDQK